MTEFINIEIWAHRNGRYGGFDGTDHVFIYSTELNKQWKCFSSREYDRNDCTFILSTELPRELFLNLMSENSELYVRNQITGTCHTIANRALILANEDLDVRDSGGDDISVVLFGKYGVNINAYKDILKVQCEKIYGENSSSYLDTYFSRVDNCLDFEIDSWVSFISRNIEKYKDKIDLDFLKKLQEIPKENFKPYLNDYIRQRELIDNKHKARISDSSDKKALYYNELWNTCKQCIVDAIINEIKYDNKDLLKKVLSDALEKAFRTRCNI